MSGLLEFLLNNEPQFRKARLTALYSDFSHLRHTNPDGYFANIEAWTQGLAHASREGAISGLGSSPNLLILNFDDGLLRSLETKEWGRPLGLGTVIHEALNKKEMMPLKEFMDAKEGIYHKSWAVRPWALVEWGLQQLGFNGGSLRGDSLPVAKLVVLSNLEEAAREFLKRSVSHRSRAGRIYSREAFGETFGDVLGTAKRLSEDDMEVFLRFLARDKGAIAYDGNTIKLHAPGETSASSINAEDTTISSLKTLIADLEIQTTLLNRRIDELGITAHQAVSRKNRVSALAALRSKKLAESTLTKRQASLAQLEEVLSSIEQAADQVELVRVMEASTHVLSGLNREVGGVERVDNVVDKLRDQMTLVDEVGNVIAEVGQGTGVDDTAVDEELAAMEAEDKQKREESKRLEKEEKEKQDAVQTKRKLEALEDFEQQATLANDKKVVGQLGTDKVLESAQELERLSISDQPRAHLPA